MFVLIQFSSTWAYTDHQISSGDQSAVLQTTSLSGLVAQLVWASPGACVVRNPKSSGPGLPVTCYQYNLPCLLFCLLVLGTNHFTQGDWQNKERNSGKFIYSEKITLFTDFNNIKQIQNQQNNTMFEDETLN